MSRLKDRLVQREPMVGTFVRTPSPVLCDVISRTALDFACLDAEHAPFGPLEIDHCMIPFRASGMPVVVRIPAFEPRLILNALDSGAAGILVPHVTTAKIAREIVKAAHFGSGGRGYAGSSRAAHYGMKPMADHIRDSAASTVVIVQIEDREALDNLDEIAQVDGLDGLFVGRMDLTVSLGASSPQDAAVVEAVARVCQSGLAHGRSVGMFTQTIDETARWKKQGASFFILGSDHAFVNAGAAALKAGFDQT